MGVVGTHNFVADDARSKSVDTDHYSATAAAAAAV